MSKWRLRGFVQDSDDEEEDLESTPPHTNERTQGALTERVNSAFSKATNTSKNQKETASHLIYDGVVRDKQAAPASRSTPDRRIEPIHPPTSPITPSVEDNPSAPQPRCSLDVDIGALRELSESPDPIQGSLGPKGKSGVVLSSSQSLGIGPSLEAASTSRAEVVDDESSGNASEGNTSARGQDLADWGLSPLPDASQSDILSDPPSDFEQNSPTRVVFASPKHRAVVQVVIPRSTTAQRQKQEQGMRRSLRERQLIQIHPYLVEGERYKRELQGRGIKPVVARERSPTRRIVHEDVETQEQDFDPNNTRPSSSPAELIFSTPVVGRPTKHAHRTLDRQPQSGSKSQRPHPSAPIVSSGVKRRKLNQPSTQAAPLARKTVYHHDRPFSNVWDVPQSPPHSSSPPTDRADTTHLPSRSFTGPREASLPTPLHTSSLHGDAQPEAEAESDSEPIARSIHRSRENQHRLITIPSDSSSSDTESEHSESLPREDIRRVGKRIKGVLPASWLRLDQVVQERRKFYARERPDTVSSPEKPEPPRGVAQKIMRRRRSPKSPSQPSSQSHGLVVISDESDNETDNPLYHGTEVHQSAQVASELAALLDRQYANEIDSDDMENDSLDLGRLGGPTEKRKKQTKLTDTFTKSKKMKIPAGIARKFPTVPRVRTHDRSRTATLRKAERSPLPALSVLDFGQSSSTRKQDVPQFLRLARRQARQRPDHARQSPRSKHIRLHTLRDTVDANVVLQQWRSGALKPNGDEGEPKKDRENREPLLDTNTNQMRYQLPQDPKDDYATYLGQRSRTPNKPPRIKRKQELHPGLSIFRRGAPSFNELGPCMTTPSQARISSRQKRVHSSCRAAQLEGLETDFGRVDRKFAFAHGLRQVDQQYNLQLPHAQPARNPQLARFLADDDTVLPPLPSVEDLGEQAKVSPAEQPLNRKRRLIRKVHAQRLDVDLREYRQPSEPVLHDVLRSIATGPLELDHVQDQDQHKPTLQGLGSHGTRYPTSFDVLPMNSDTYFHTFTFIGGLELHRALQCGSESGRDLDEPAGYFVIQHDSKAVRCGPWNDETFSLIDDLMHTIWVPLDEAEVGKEDHARLQHSALRHSAKVLRSLSHYLSTHLSFLDSIDRQAFAANMKQWAESLFGQTFAIAIRTLEEHTTPEAQLDLIRTMTYLLVLTMQIRQIAQHSVVDSSIALELANLIKKNSKLIVTHLLRRVSAISEFLERNNHFKERENGIQNSDILVESLVICMQVLTTAKQSETTFWDLVSQELSTRALKAAHVKQFDTLWGTLFTLLPFVEFDDSGILTRDRRLCFAEDNWTLVRDLLKRLFSLYPQTARTQSSTLNDYVCATLTRCHILIDNWHWVRCDPMLSAIFDFFAKNGLRQLRREPGNGSARFLEGLAGKPTLKLEPNDHSFHIFLKSLALGLKGMRGEKGEFVGKDDHGGMYTHNAYSDKKLRSIVFRLTPNHGRSHPKDQHLDAESLDALRNHHDLLCTLYWQSPPACRPRLDLIKGLVNHGNAHREACRLNVRAWSNLAAFQTSTNEPYTFARPFAEWYKEMTTETLKQYRLAKTEAEDYLRFGTLDSSDTTSLMVRQTMEKNQEQPIASLRDCIVGMQRVVESSANRPLLREFIMDSDLVQLLELPHFEDTRLVAVIRDTLKVLRAYATLTTEPTTHGDAHQASEESQDYGDSFDLEDFHIIEQQGSEALCKQKPLDFIHVALWHLLSNAFGAEKVPDANLLMECIDTWALIAGRQVSSGARHWSEYIDSLGHVSWQQLRRTEQTQKFSPYFTASLLTCDPATYKDHKFDFTGALLLSLADREAMLRFQHRLLCGLLKVAPDDPLLTNLPFHRGERDTEFDITADTLRARRLQVISCILANMRDHVQQTIREEPKLVPELRGNYNLMLKNFMAAMRSNYQQLSQGATVTGAYVEFVQKVIQFLQQYTADICPVLDFFTNSAAFPLPATDPTYVIGRLCGYAPKLATAGVPKQLSVFIQTVAQQAAAGNQQMYLVDQLETALCTDEAPSRDKTALRDVLLQGIFPAYIEAAFVSPAGFVITSPVIQSLSSILKTLLFDIRVNDRDNVRSHYDTIMAIALAFIRSTEQLKEQTTLFQEPHILRAIALMLEILIQIVPLLDYIYGRYFTSTTKPTILVYFEQLNTFIAEILHNGISLETPSYEGDLATAQSTHFNLLLFSREGLETSIKSNWSAQTGHVFFGQGRSKREVLVDLGSVEEEKARLVSSIEAFYAAMSAAYRDGPEDNEGRAFLGDIDV